MPYVAKKEHMFKMLDALQWLNVKQRIMYRTMVVIFKIEHNMMPKYQRDRVKYVGDNNRYPLRNAGDIRLANIKSESNRNSLVYKCFDEFNKMPKNSKEERNINIFKRKVTDYVRIVFK